MVAGPDGPADRWLPAPRRQSEISSEVSPKSPPGGLLRAGGATIDLAEGRVTAPDGAVTELRRQSARPMLRLLAARAGHTVPKPEILDRSGATSP